MGNAVNLLLIAEYWMNRAILMLLLDNITFMPTINYYTGMHRNGKSYIMDHRLCASRETKYAPVVSSVITLDCFEEGIFATLGETNMLLRLCTYFFWEGKFTGLCLTLVLKHRIYLTTYIAGWANSRVGRKLSMCVNQGGTNHICYM